ncbi:TPA: hypothetical protein RQK93_002052 [Vibrio vulnificus]|nr:hypothetical protein [Vibrio vulnificus]
MSNKKRQNKAILKRYEQESAPLDKLHRELFPEEYDFHYDSNVDSKLRQQGVNPMSDQYQREVNLRRLAMGVEPYMGTVGVECVDGLISSQEYCQIKLEQSISNI